jgi:hypothetical protein
MSTNRQKTLDDMEPVIPFNLEEAIEINTATRKNLSGKYSVTSNAGKQLYEKIQEQKELEALSDPYFDF